MQPDKRLNSTGTALMNDPFAEYVADSKPAYSPEAFGDAPPHDYRLPNNGQPVDSDPFAEYTVEPVAVVEQPKLKLPDYKRGVGRSVLQGALLGFGDEAAAGIATGLAKVTGNIPEGQTLADTYKDIKGTEAVEQAAFVAENPKTAFGAELAGGLVTAGLTGGQSMAGAKTLGQVAKVGALQGGKLGAVYGAGTAETGETVGESAVNMAGGALKGGAIGAATGGLLTPALVGTGRVASAGVKNIADRFFKSDAEKAATYVQQLAEQSGFTPEQIAARYEKLGPQATLADVSENLLAGAKSATDQIGPTKEAARALVGNRQQGQFGETVGILSKQLGGVSPADAAAALAKNAQERSVQAGPLYESALKSVVPQSEQLQKLQALPAFKQAYSQAGTYAANDLSRVAKEADPNMIGGAFKAGKLTEAEKLHYAKQALYDMESAQARAGNTNAAKQIGDARKSLTNDVLDSIPGYKEARNIWSGSMAQEEALETGRQLFKLPKREFEAAIKGMTEAEKQQARLGLMDAAEENLSKVADNQNTAGRLVKDPAVRDKLSQLLDADQMKALTANAEKWEAFTRTKNKLAGGSPTAENLTVEQESARMVSDMNPIGMAKNKLFESITNPNRLTKENAEEVGKILLKQGMTQEEVTALLTKAKKDPSILRSALTAGKNALLVDYVPAGGAVADAALPTYGKIGRNADGTPKYGRIR